MTFRIFTYYVLTFAYLSFNAYSLNIFASICKLIVLINSQQAQNVETTLNQGGFDVIKVESTLFQWCMPIVLYDDRLYMSKS